MFQRKSFDHRDVRYHSLKRSGINGSDYIDTQWYGTKTIPWKAILLAFFLCVGGTCLLVTGSLIVSGHIDAKYGDRMWPLIIIGLLMFPPGAYHLHIAFCAYKEYPGYSFTDIPEFD
uniref:Transmembrane protein 230 n=2 Tax=Cuerna arida TaxID=1464854 RepID=A0A1B6H2C1_9HEMI